MSIHNLPLTLLVPLGQRPPPPRNRKLDLRHGQCYNPLPAWTGVYGVIHEQVPNGDAVIPASRTCAMRKPLCSDLADFQVRVEKK